MPQCHNCWVVCVGVARHANAGGIIEDVGERIKIRVMILGEWVRDFADDKRRLWHGTTFN